ncbi:MAG TPA: NINE protein [Candidatus Aphodovivens avistercoris]|nr:NINE protein [Candidatus Aphodovivens avistercoris]
MEPRTDASQNETPQPGAEQPAAAAGGAGSFPPPTGQQPSFDQQVPQPGQPPFGAHAAGQPPFGAPGAGQPFYGQPPFGQGSAAQVSAGQPPFGQAGPAQAPYGQPAGAVPPYGQQPYGQAQRPFGQQAYGQAQPPYGQQPYGQAQPPYAQQPYAQQPFTPPSYARQPVVTKDHVAAGLLALFLGVFGVHKFYLGYNTAGFVMLAITILGSLLTIGIASIVMWVISLVEGIIYLSKSQSAFDLMYVAQKKEWF